MALGQLTEFKSLIERGRFSRKNQYEFTITPPPGVTYAGGGMKTLMLRCESVTLPGQNMSSSIDEIRMGPGREHVFSVTYAPITAVFLADESLNEKRFFEDWQDLMFNRLSGFKLGYYEDYVSDMKISQLDAQGSSTYEVKLFDAWPKTVTQMDLSAADAELARISVEIVFYKWERIYQGAPGLPASGSGPS